MAINIYNILTAHPKKLIIELWSGPDSPPCFFKKLPTLKNSSFTLIFSYFDYLFLSLFLKISWFFHPK